MSTREAIITQFLNSDFPQCRAKVKAVGNGTSSMLQAIEVADLRPGGTVSGPAIMELADIALYVAVLGHIGIEPTVATTSFNVNFLRPAKGQGVLRAECKLIKTGRTLAVGEVSVYLNNGIDPIAHVVATYALPALTQPPLPEPQISTRMTDSMTPPPNDLSIRGPDTDIRVLWP